MTSRSDLARVFAALQVLGTEAESPTPDGRTKIVLAWDRTDGWTYGPRKPPPQWELNSEPTGTPAEPTERDAEEKQRHRASQHHLELIETIATLDRATQVMFRLIDLAVPPNPAEVKNRRTGEYEPWTSAEVELAGYCSSCWRHEQTFTPIYVDRKGTRRWRGSCSWCGPFRSQHKIDPPMVLLAKHLEGKNVTAAEYEEAIGKAKAPKKKRKKKRTAA